MAVRSIASLTLSFGLVSIPVKLYSATESSAGIRFNLLAQDGSRVRQQYVSEKDQKVVPRNEMIKGYEFEKDHYVTFTPDELKALEEGASHAIEIVSFIPEKAVDPIYYDKAYFLAPDKRGAKPYNLLMESMRQSGRCALGKWAWKGKQYIVQVRTGEDGLVLQQLLYGEEVRSMKELDIEKVEVSQAELKLAMQLIDQISQDSYDPDQYQDEEKKRIEAAIDEKIAGKQIVTNAPHVENAGAQVIDLMEALRASLGGGKPAKAAPATPPAASGKGKAAAAEPAQAIDLKQRKGVKRAAKTEEAAPVAKTRARK